jgi:hypothetical protein
MKGPAFFLCPTRIDADVTLYFLLQIAVAFSENFTEIQLEIKFTVWMLHEAMKLFSLE